jgi:membrane protease YdiL (CAAX protease family)
MSDCSLQTADEALPPRRRLYVALALAFGMTFPTAAAWCYFLGLAAHGGETHSWQGRAQQAAYAGGKVVQFSFPVVFLAWIDRRLPWPSRPHYRGLALGLGFGLLVAGVMLAVYFGALRGSPVLAKTPASVRHKLEEVHMATPARYAVLALFVVVAHSLLEEYYWRWFVFGQLRRLLSLAAAVLLSSLAFMAHHVVVLYVYLPGRFLSLGVPFSLAIAVGGAAWALLYDRSGSIYSPWLSHLLIDAAIFVIGWDLLWPLGG